MDTNGNTKELIKDLCCRLSYGVKAQYYGIDEEDTMYDTIDSIYVIGNGTVEVGIGQYGLNIEDIKPYLFPLSSMTEEQKKEFDQLLELELKVINDEINHTQATAFEVDFYHKHHLDWRGLIPKGIALDATGLNIY